MVGPDRNPASLVGVVAEEAEEVGMYFANVQAANPGSTVDSFPCTTCERLQIAVGFGTTRERNQANMAAAIAVAAAATVALAAAVVAHYTLR